MQPKIHQHIAEMQQYIEHAWRNMKACDQDHHEQGATMWMSIALDWEQRLDQYREIMKDVL
jgi:hypothetical protein